MKKNAIFVLAILLILPAMLFTVSCAKKAVESQPEVTAPEPAPAAEPAPAPAPAPEGSPGMAADNAAMERERLAAVERARQEEAERQRQAAAKQFGGEDIHFEFDSAVLLPEAQLILGGKADFLSANNVSVTIEGHCDERGTDAYNMALGQRRAEAVWVFPRIGFPPSAMVKKDPWIRVPRRRRTPKTGAPILLLINLPETGNCTRLKPQL